MSSNQTDNAETAQPLITKRAAEAALASVFIGSGGLMLFDNLKTGIAWTEYGPEAGMFPFWLSLLMVFLGIGALISALRKEAPPERSVPSFMTREDFRALLTIALPTIVFIMSIGWLGIYLPSFVLIAGFMALAGRFRWAASIATAAVVVLSLFWLFEIEFLVFLPKGPIEALLGF